PYSFRARGGGRSVVCGSELAARQVLAPGWDEETDEENTVWGNPRTTEDRMDEERRGNPSGEGIDATQQVGDELPSGVRYGQNNDANMDDPSASGGLDADQPGTVNTAAGLSVGGTGAGIEPGVDASLGSGFPDADEFIADVY